jgi:hypothetical protein
VSALRRFGAFWWNFVIGDDWRLAFGGAVALALTALFVHAGFAAWWITPAIVIVVLVLTLFRRPPPIR